MPRPPHATRNLALIIVGLLFVASIPLVFARQSLVQPDGRINQVAHFGGDALYCVDGNMNVINQLPTADPKGFRLLDMNGQQLWYVPGHDVEAALEKSVIGGDWQLIATGNGTYGPVSLYTWNVGGPNGIFYEFIGYDEHGKINTLVFQSCIVGPAVGGASNTPLPTGTLVSDPTAGPSPTASDTLPPGDTNTPTDTLTPSNTPTASDTLSPTNSPTATDTLTPTNTFTATDTLTPTNTFTPTDTATQRIT